MSIPCSVSNVVHIDMLKFPSMEGFIVFDYIKEYPAALRELSQWLAEGKIQRKETIVEGGLGVAEEALRGLYHGVNTGKLIVEVSKADEAVGKAKL
jgi:NADPH-dependent curcumin reductase CurA